MTTRLLSRLDAGTAAVGVVGLGYVGLPVACMLASTGLRVTGVDVKPDRVQAIAAGRLPIQGREPGLADLLGEVTVSGRLRATTDHAELAAADVVLICVETPVDADHRPLYTALRAACRSVGSVLADDALVVVESTVAPGTTEGLVRPLLRDASGRRFFLGHCPERIMPGRLLVNLRTMSRVVGAESPAVGEVMRRLYRRYVEADLDVTDVLSAELVKTAENAYRDVNIAFANQVALVCEAAGGDVWRVRELVNKAPGRRMLLPGGGVGGHCIPKDPWLLAAALGEGRAALIEAARQVNESMPEHVAALTLGVLEEAGVTAREAVVAVLGYSYLENSDDVRHSPGAALVAQLAGAVAQVRVHDPHVPAYQGDPGTTLAGADVAVVMVAHEAYRTLDLAAAGAAMRRRLLVDARHVYDYAALTAAGFTGRTLGVGRRHREER